MKQRYAKAAIVGTGALDTVVAPGDEVFSKFAIQVSTPSGAITSWTVVVEGSLDGVSWTTIATHNANIGSIVQVVDKPCTHFRANVSALSLGTAPSIKVDLVGAP